MANRTIEYNRLSISLNNPETLHALDDYKNTKGISRSKAVNQILDACVPILKEITYHHNNANELESRLLNKVYRRDMPRPRSVVAAENHCLDIWQNKLQSGVLIDFDASNGLEHVILNKRHTRRDNGIGKVERQHIERLCQNTIKSSDANYAIFIYFERDVYEREKREYSNDSTSIKKIKISAGNGIALLAKSYFHNEYFFDFEGAILINVNDLIPSGVYGIEETRKNSDAFCWISIITYQNKTVIMPVYKVNPIMIPTQRKPNDITIIHHAVNSQMSD